MKSAREILGVSANASMDDITAAYRKMASLYHPDKVAHLAPEFQVMAEQRMKEINAAYQELKEPNGGRARIPPQQPTAQPIDAFLSFAGFSYGDKVQKVHKLFGNPHNVIDKLEYGLLFYTYYPNDFGVDTLSISHHRNTGVISTIGISDANVILRLRAKSIIDPKFSYYGQHLNVIQAAFGKPQDEVAEIYVYHLYPPNQLNRDEDSYVGHTTFTCYSFDDYKCTDLTVQWFYTKEGLPKF